MHAPRTKRSLCNHGSRSAREGRGPRT
jgi:hypothetical protein